jgi:uncharacterized protein YkwD
MIALVLALTVVGALQVMLAPPTLRFLDQASSAVVYASSKAAGQETGLPANSVTDAQQLAALLNERRVKAGLPPLAWDDTLADAALQHTLLMAQRNELAHELAGEPPLRERLANTNLRLDRSAENIAFESSVEAADRAFMRSPEHRANILNPAFDAVGIAVVPAAGKLYITENFAHRLPELSDAQAFDLISGSFAALRRSAGTPVLTPLEDARASDLACSMARKDKLDHNIGLTLPGARYAVAYTTAIPDQLPSDVERLASARDIDRYAVGVCFARTPTFPNGAYWVLMVFFSPQQPAST